MKDQYWFRAVANLLEIESNCVQIDDADKKLAAGEITKEQYDDFYFEMVCWQIELDAEMDAREREARYGKRTVV